MKSKCVAPQPSRYSVSKALRFSLILLFASACQVAFGDFDFDLSKLAVSCQSSVTRCKDGKIQTCVNGNEWQLVADCSSSDRCNLNQLKCETCQPGSYQCNEAQPQLCGSDLKWSAATLAPCASAALCKVADDASLASCTPPGCPADGDLQCVGDHLQRCPASLVAWEDIELCASAALCDINAAKAQVAAHGFPTCVVPPCSPGQLNCGSGDPPICPPGEFRCNDDLSTLERCRGDGGKWEFVEQCVNRRLCNPKATRCEVPACTDAGATRCKGEEFQVCRDDLTRWDQTALCSAAGACDPVKGCLPLPCTEGDYRCNDVALEQCIQSTWTRTNTCATTALCNATQQACIPPTCARGERRCVGTILQRCNGAQDGWVELETCSGKSVCSQETKRCEPG